MSEMADAIRELTQEKGFSLDSVKQTIENTLRAAYKRTFGTADNCIVTFSDDMSDVSVASRKTIVDGVYDPVTEIELEDARKLSDEVEIGDEIDIREDPKTFDRSAVSTGKQTAHQGLNETLRDSLYNQYKDKVGEMINGYYQREKNGNIYINLGNEGRLEGVLPTKYQSPRESYEMGDRIKAIITELKKTNSGLQIVLSRSDPRLVEIAMEMEVPEIDEGTVKIEKCVRDAGYRTKMAVSTTREEIDPVGACVGKNGLRIQNVIRELLGEKIDVLRYDPDPTIFIQNALSPAKVSRVIIMDAEKKQALAIVDDDQFSLAIGKSGQNVRLANRLCDWNIDVKTEEQCEGMDLSSKATTVAARSLFNDEVVEEENDEIYTISELPGIKANVAEAIKNAGLDDIVQFLDSYEGLEIEGVTKEELSEVYDLIKENVEIVEEEGEEAAAPASEEEQTAPETEEEEEGYRCPNCGEPITIDMTQCPKCGTEFEFTEDEE